MDFGRPVEALIPDAQGRVLGTLARTTAELTLTTLADLSGVSLAHVARIVPRLVDLGVVERRDVPPAALVRLMRDNIAARGIVALADLRHTLLDELRITAQTIEPAPVSVIVFGSFARGDDDRGSDIDVVVVRPTEVDADDDRWIDQLEQWRLRIRRAAGNPVEVIDVDVDEAAGKLVGHSQLWRDVRRDGVVVFGDRIGELAGRANA